MSRTWFGHRDKAGSASPMDPVSPAGRSSGMGGSRASSPLAPPLTEGLSPSDPPRALLTIDALGRKCPIPIIMVAEQIRDVPVGEIIAVLADDPAAYTDVPAWCGMKSHEFVFREELESGWSFGIRRRY